LIIFIGHKRSRSSTYRCDEAADVRPNFWVDNVRCAVGQLHIGRLARSCYEYEDSQISDSSHIEINPMRLTQSPK
jgi:hypothetical protein